MTNKKKNMENNDWQAPAAALELAKQRCRAAMEKIKAINPCHSKISKSCNRTLLRLATSELNFLSSSSYPPPPGSLSVNIGYLEALIFIIQQPCVTAVSRVCNSVVSLGNNDEKHIMAREGTVHVDILCSRNGSPVWFIVSDRNPKYVSWHGSSKRKGVKEKVEQVVSAAHSCLTLKPSSVIFFFSRGIDYEVQEKFKEEYKASDIGFEFSGFDFCSLEEEESDWVTVLARSFHPATVLEIKVDHFKDKPLEVEHAFAESVGSDSALMLERHDILDLGDSFYSLMSKMKIPSTSFSCAESTASGAPLSAQSLINFDTTALIAIVSGISNGGSKKLLSASEETLRRRFKSNFDFVIAQVCRFFSVAYKILEIGTSGSNYKNVESLGCWLFSAADNVFDCPTQTKLVLVLACFQVDSEMESPILLELCGLLYGKRGIVCKSAMMEFKELVNICGGRKEKLRADQLLRHLVIVPDHSSKRVTSLPTTRKLALKNKIVFGTGDYWCAPTLTANMAFVRSVSQTGMSLGVVEHRPRALIGE